MQYGYLNFFSVSATKDLSKSIKVYIMVNKLNLTIDQKDLCKFILAMGRDGRCKGLWGLPFGDIVPKSIMTLKTCMLLQNIILCTRARKYHGSIISPGLLYPQSVRAASMTGP